jgi:hypothetical protein
VSLRSYPHAAVFERQVDIYRSYAPAAAPAHWGADEMITGPDAETVAAGLVAVREAAGVDALNLRVHVPGVAVDAARDQIVRISMEVLPLMRHGTGGVSA